MTSPHRKKRLRDLLAAFRKDTKGANAVEFALVAPAFIALLIGIIQIFLVFFGQQLLQQVVQQSARQILTGQVQGAGMTQTQFSSLVCSQVRIIFNCNKLMISVQSASSWSTLIAAAPTLTFDANGNVTNNWPFSPGGPGDKVILEVIYQWPVFGGPLGFTLANLPNGNRQITASAAFQNEPYQ
ncbi:TadE/TadG family type IV pilus assembly protein [Bradyrhizobium sp. CCBAU 51627]|uniref:TadE/TadG family type IV pilus assembly protein n=1 Tax=Bradyrhizobium sp. CCBAU 51627 TaxID=1325088 RepID=UPI0023050FD7|nr:TadE/TadG family type IV pilus assembly protein [Bradyrhizobium sp. CCBAU 51627]MDA9435141.1 pilus assembly protein TadE [Bradyrhizobium sp. CCBAU 51627]